MENRVQAWGEAPRVTPSLIEEQVIAEHYFTAYEGRMGSIVEGTYQSKGTMAGSDLDLTSLRLLTFCVLVLRNGYTVTGTSACPSPENFDAGIGRDIARKNAINEIWPLLGYELKTRLHHQEQICEGDVLGRALSKLLAHSMGNPSTLSAEDAQLILAELIPTNPQSNSDIAKICHEANRAWCELNGDFSQPKWEEAPDWQRESAIAGVIFHRANPHADDSASHDAWAAQKLADGWVYGEIKDPEAKTHPCLVPFDQLPHAQQFKDRLFRTIVKASIRPVIAPTTNHLRLVQG